MIAPYPPLCLPPSSSPSRFRLLPRSLSLAPFPPPTSLLDIEGEMLLDDPWEVYAFMPLK